jgi:hypothetical protein
MNTTQKQRIFWLAGLAVAAVYIAPSFFHRRPPVVPLPGAPGAGNVFDPLNTIAGLWQGVAPLPGRGTCILRFELRRKGDDPGQFSGYPRMVCVPSVPILRGPAAANATPPKPMAAILTGKTAGGAIEFTVDQVIADSLAGCVFTSFTVTPFGTDQIDVRWKEGMCEGGQMTLRRVGR